MSVSPTADIFKGDKSMIIKTRDAVTSTNFRTSYAQISDTVNDVLGIKAFYFGISVKFIEVAHAQG